MTISELSEEDRRSVEHWVELVPTAFRECEVYLRDYREDAQSAIKLLCVLDNTRNELDEARADLMKRHHL
jgi:hypothetical protein